MGKAYMGRKIQIPGRAPVPDPGEKPERPRQFVKALLGNPLKLVHVDSEDDLILPAEEDV